MRYPLQSLIDHLDLRAGPGWCTDVTAGGVIPLIADALEVSTRTVDRRVVTGLTEAEADHLACHLANTIPTDIWPSWGSDVEPDPRWWCDCAEPEIEHRHCARCEGFIHPTAHPAVPLGVAA